MVAIDAAFVQKTRLTEQVPLAINILFRNGVRDAVVGNLPESAALATVDIFACWHPSASTFCFGRRCKDRCPMTARSNELSAPRSGPFTALRNSMSRDEFFAGLYILGCANGLGVGILQAANSGDWTGGLRNVSVIVWFACIAGVSLLLCDKDDKIRLADVPVAVVFLASSLFR
jgi:hypothetical protein